MDELAEWATMGRHSASNSLINHFKEICALQISVSLEPEFSGLYWLLYLRLLPSKREHERA